MRARMLTLACVAAVAAYAQSAAFESYSACGPCVAAGFGWSAQKQKCGGFRNKACGEVIVGAGAQSGLAAAVGQLSGGAARAGARALSFAIDEEPLSFCQSMVQSNKCNQAFIRAKCSATCQHAVTPCIYGYEPSCAWGKGVDTTAHVHSCKPYDKPYFYEQYDYGLVRTYREDFQSYCDSPPRPGISYIRCSKATRRSKWQHGVFYHEDPKHPENKYKWIGSTRWDIDRGGYWQPDWSKKETQGPQQMCEARGVWLNFTEGRAYHMLQDYYPFDIGTHCTPKWTPENTNGARYTSYSWGKTLSRNKPIDDVPRTRGQVCSHALPLSAEAGRVVRHMRPVLVVESENYNIYHQYCTWMMAYLTLHIRGWDEDQVAQRIDVLALGRDRGITGGAKKLRDLGLEVLSKFGSVKTVDANFDKRSVCFEDITFAVHGWVAPNIISGNQDWQPCMHSRLYRDFSSFLLKSYGLKEIRSQHEFSRLNKYSDVVRISVIVRRSTGAKSGSRVIINEDKMLEALRSLEGDGAVQGRHVEVNELVMEKLSFKEQIAAMATTDLLVGMHGAGMTFLVFLPHTSAVVELISVPTTLKTANWYNESDRFDCLIDRPTGHCLIWPEAIVFETLSRLCNVPHQYAKNTDPERHYQIGTPEKNIKIANIMIDIEAFLATTRNSLAGITKNWKARS